MKTDKLRSFLAINSIDYDSLPYSGEHESYRDYSHKMKWLRLGKATLKEIAQNIGAEAVLNTNPSGDIDRGYVTGFFTKNGKAAFVQLSDGVKDILYRTAESTKDYSGGRNNTMPLVGQSFDHLTEWLQETLVS